MRLLDQLMNGIATHNWTLIDPGLGVPTTWGRWGPSDVNDNRAYSVR